MLAGFRFEEPHYGIHCGCFARFVVGVLRLVGYLLNNISGVYRSARRVSWATMATLNDGSMNAVDMKVTRPNSPVGNFNGILFYY